MSTDKIQANQKYNVKYNAINNYSGNATICQGKQLNHNASLMLREFITCFVLIC